MAKDDYFVIVYQILSYLYKCLKSGIPVQPEMLAPEGKLFRIHADYWKYILLHLTEDGYIEGLTLTRAYGEDYPLVDGLEHCRITPKGIAYLCENSLAEKAKRFLKDMNDLNPFSIRF